MEQPATESLSTPATGQRLPAEDSASTQNMALENENTGHLNLELRIVELLQRIRTEQESYVTLRRERWEVVDYSPIARSLWGSNDHAWVGHTPDHWGEFDDKRAFGKEFLTSLLPSPSNMKVAGDIIKKQSTKAFSAPREDKYFSGTWDWSDTNPFLWPGHDDPRADWDSSTACCRIRLQSANRLDDVNEPFDINYADSTPESMQELINERESCGLIVQLCVDGRFNTIDPDTAAGILCFIRNDWNSSNPEFLDGHIAEWRERSTRHSCGFRGLVPTESSNGLRGSERQRDINGGVFMHFMRSFVVDQKTEQSNPLTKGLRCIRDYVTFQGFYDDKVTIKLVEKRFSTAICILPLQQPVGHFALVSICDDQGPGNVREMFTDSPGGYNYVGARAYPWKKYGIHPAGLYTGISMFQLQICTFIDSWEQDWNHTIRKIDAMVSLKLNILENEQHLRDLVLNNKTDISVSYFKVLQFLNFFSDTVRAAPKYLDILSRSVRNRHAVDYWFEKSYPHAHETGRILEHNWDIVRKRQGEASSRILAKLERTINEVKSLQSGLFSVQSITEAQKSRVLNKYLLVFTIVTILFLPPTFVATIFGMDAFNSDSVDATQRSFWTVLGSLSGVTYLLAALGLFGSHLSAEKRRRWEEQTKARWDELFSRLKERGGERQREKDRSPA